MSKRLVIVLLGLGLVLGGCSSPEQKRNAFDKCVLDYVADYAADYKKKADRLERLGYPKENKKSNEKARLDGEIECAYLLD